MTVLSQSTYTLKRVAKEGYSASLTPETIALPANSAGEVQDYSTAKAKLRLTYNGKEIYPVFDSSLSKEIDGGSATIGTLVTLNCIASINASGEVSITNLASNAGYVDIPISYGQFSTVKRLTVAKSKQGRSIVSSSYEYAQSTSATTAPTTGWVTTPPTWIDGRYIWVRTKITYSEGSPVTTDPINLTGAGGAVGTGINTITTEFYLSTSKTTQTGGSWSATRPAWVSGKFLWTRLKIVYKNPASTVYTTPVVSSEWEAVNDLRTELVLDYTSKLDVLEDRIEANVTETASVKNSVTGLTTRVSEAEASLTIQSGQISSKVAKTDYDANNVAVNQQISLIQQQANQVDIKVGRMRTGAKNLLRNYDMSIASMKYWSTGATLVTESGTPTQQLTVLSVIQPSSITTTQGGAVYPPSAIVLNISDGSTRTVGVLWGSYSSSTVGTFTIPGSYNLPSGITGNKPAVSFTLIVGTAALTAVSVAQPNGVSVPQGGTPELPTTVTLNISDGTVRTVAVTWSSYSTTTSGTFMLTGTYTLPSGITGNKPSVSLSLTVASVITITSIVAPNNATITAGGTYTPPATITLNLSTGTNQTVPVTWSFYDINVPGVYTLNGSYNLPEGVTGSKPSVSYTLTVSEQPVSLTITSVVQPSDVSVEQGGTITLPTTVTLNISDGSTRTAPVTWGEYSTGSAGNYTINGSYNLPSGVTGDKPAVSVALTVVAPLTIIFCSNWPFNQTVYQGDTVNLGADYPTLTFTLSDNTTVTIPVTWSAVDTSTVGEETSTASYTNPPGVTGSYSVTVTITVLEVVHIDIKQRLMSTYGYTPADRTISVGLTLTGFYLENPQADPVFHNLIDSFALATPGEFTIYAYIARFYSGNPVIRLTYTDGSVVTSAISGWVGSKGSILLLPSGKTLSSATIVRDGDTLFVGAIEIRRTGNYPSWWT